MLRPATRPLRSLALGLSSLVLLVAAGFFVARPTVAQTWPSDQAVIRGDCGGTSWTNVDIETRPGLWLEVASTDAERSRGLMLRQSLDPDSGMLFVFPFESRGGFWMYNTLIPLSIAWIDANGIIVDIQDMYPLPDPSDQAAAGRNVHTPSGPYWYALEANLGWFEAHGVGVGQRLLTCIEQPV